MPEILSKPSSYQEKIQRSDFICFLFPVQDAVDLKDILARHQKDYANATHNCYAYILGANQQTQYYSDAGEPGGTAGKPILNALLRAEMTNILAIVTRFYGGIKLGVKGLIDAYGGVTARALQNAQKIPYRQTAQLDIECDYPCFELVQRYSHGHGLQLEDSSFSQEVKIRLVYDLEQEQELIHYLDGLLRQYGLVYKKID